MAASVLVIACGAIAHELIRIRDMNGWNHIEFQCLPAELHNTPEKIPGAVCSKIEAEKKNFERLVIRGLGLDRQPQLMPVYFGNYKRVVYLAQTQSEELQSMAEEHAKYLGLEYSYSPLGDEPLSLVLTPKLNGK